MSKPLAKPSVFGGTMIVAGTAIGAGMLALPTISAGMWVFWSIALMLVSWGMTYLSSRAILEVNLHYEVGDNFNSLVKNTLGPVWNVINGFSFAFVFYIVLYAYVSGGSSTVNYYLSTLGMPSNTMLSGLIFSLFLITVVFVGAVAVDKVASIMMVGLIVAFITSMSGMTVSISPLNLFDQSGDNKSVFVWMALSTYMLSFTYHNCVPSLVKYFGKENPNRTVKCFLYGSLISVVIYLLWILLVQGNVSRDTFRSVIAEGGNVDVLLKYTGAGTASSFIKKALDMFAFFALTTSFLGVGLGLYDFIADLLKIDDSKFSGKIKITLLTFTLPVIGGLFFPNGFISAIGWAGLFSTVWVLIIPGLMLLTIRKQNRDVGFSAYKGNFFSYAIISYGVLIAVCHVLSDVLNLFPKFQ